MKKFKLKLSKKNVILITCTLIILPVIAYLSYVVYLLYFSKTPTFVSSPVEDTNTKIEDTTLTEELGIDNIVLFGVDDRTPTDHGRTDSIIIATVDKNSKVIKLTSLMRDLYVEIGSTKSMSRINSAYAFGGPDLAIETINKNFDMDIKYYAIVDFKAFQDLVENVGGIDVDVKDYEVNEINKYISEVNGNNSILLKNGGFQHLNGQQALSFARIRKVGDGDFERTERQRIVLKCLADKIKQVNMLKVPQLLTSLLTYAQTNIPASKIISLGVTAYKFDGAIQSLRIPVDGYYEGQNVYGASVLVPDLKANAQFIKEFIYNVKFTGNKDVPSYMQNNFHIDDSMVASKPKANIPNLNTPTIQVKTEDEQENHTKTTTIPSTVTKPVTNSEQTVDAKTVQKPPTTENGKPLHPATQ